MKLFVAILFLLSSLGIEGKAQTLFILSTNGTSAAFTFTPTNITYLTQTNLVNQTNVSYLTETNLVDQTNVSYLTETNIVTETNVVDETNSVTVTNTPPPVTNPPPPAIIYYEITNNLAVWYPLAGDLNDYWSGDNASSAQTPVWTDGVLGNSGAALFFSGNQGLTANDNNLPMGNTPRTFSFWVYLTQLPSSGNAALFFQYGTQSYGDFMNCYLQNNSGTMDLQIYAGGNGNGAVLFPFNPPINQWFNLTVEIDANNTFSLFENGVLINSEILQPPQTSPGGTLWIGEWNNQSYLHGAMADFRIYNAALPQGALMTNFLAVYNSITVSPDLLYLKMQDDINATPPYSYVNWPAPLADSSGNANIAATNYDGTPDNPWVTNVVPDNAMHFHGVPGSYIDTHDTTDFAFTNQNYTINIWVYPYTDGDVFMACGLQNVNGWSLSQDNSFNTHFDVYNNGNTYDIGGPNAKANNNAWNDICVTVQGGTNATFYYNGGIAYNGYISQALTSKGFSLWLGQQMTGPGTYKNLDGNLWQPQIWSRNLSPNDVSKLYYQQMNGVPWP